MGILQSQVFLFLDRKKFTGCLLALAREDIKLWFLQSWLNNVGRACDICANRSATGIFLHMSLNYISNTNLQSMQNQKNYKLIKHQPLNRNLQQTSIQTINRFLSQESSSTLPFETNQLSRFNQQSSISRKDFINKRFQESSESLFFQSKFSHMHPEGKGFMKNQHSSQQSEINQLRKQVQEQKTIIKLQDELILKLMSKLEQTQSKIDGEQFDKRAEDYFRVFDNLKKTRQLLQQIE